MPHEPQLFVSDVVSTQVPLQTDAPGESQLVPQTPALQTAVPPVTVGQALPHEPQLCASLWRLTQLVPQATSPLGQLSMHWPCEQTCPLGQAWPHEPQFEASVWRLTQVLPQIVSPATWQELLHLPPLHVADPPDGAVQVWPHAPQL